MSHSLSFSYFCSKFNCEIFSFESLADFPKLERKAVAEGKAEDFAGEVFANSAKRTEEEVFKGVAAEDDKTSEIAEVKADEGETAVDERVDNASPAVFPSSACCLLLIWLVFSFSLLLSAIFYNIYTTSHSVNNTTLTTD